MHSQFTALDVVIALNGNLSGAAELKGSALVGIVMPAAWDTANLTFQASYDGTTYNNVYDSSGNEVTVTAAASRFIQISPAAWSSVAYLKVRSGTSGTPVTQTAARTIKLVVREV